MTKIVMKVQISGTRNGEDWPAPGEVIDLPEDEAAQLLAQGSAALGDDAPVDDEPPVETADAPEGDVETATPKRSRAKA